ncbi:DUF6690 family protein [Lignipirellula cremea]|uniref:DUF6690 domain-containing protein n=1 Tax=Lignipirellula cremea TaxID=2528010 RepID=A0A518DQ78_9BACT|nr:DUF6690 family protein [Lignipirellula cremea]QDU94009.1 hypothetical protein Pla8534_17950 [Lignipirellula cremea]
MRKELLYLPILLAASGGPYLLQSGKPAADEEQTSTLTGLSGLMEDEAIDALPPPTLEPVNRLGTSITTAPLAGPPTSDFLEVFRFDVTPNWILQRWGRVTTALDAPGMQGLRTALVTGAQPSDVAGSLTYYFDHQQQVKRVSFQGTTGDPQRLVDSLTRAYGLRQKKSLLAGMYVSEWNGTVTSALRISQRPLISSGDNLATYDVMLELNLPTDYYQLSPEFQAALKHDFALPGQRVGSLPPSARRRSLIP